MKLGISTACFYPLETELALKKCVDMQSETHEVFLNSSSELDNSFLKLLKNTANNDFVSVHPFTSGMESYLLFSSYKRRFEDGREYYKKYYEAAAYLGAEYVVLHGAKTTGHISVSEYSERFYLMNSDARSFGITLCQENVNGFRSMYPTFISDLRKNLNDEIKFVFDIKQTYRAKVKISDMLDAMGQNIVHVHLSDNDEHNDCLLPGNGKFDFYRLFNYLSEKTLCKSGMIEVYSNSYSDYSQIQKSYNYLSCCLNKN